MALHPRVEHFSEPEMTEKMPSRLTLTSSLFKILSIPLKKSLLLPQLRLSLLINLINGTLVLMMQGSVGSVTQISTLSHQSNIPRQHHSGITGATGKNTKSACHFGVLTKVLGISSWGQSMWMHCASSMPQQMEQQEGSSPRHSDGGF